MSTQRMVVFDVAGSSEINDLAQFLDCIADVLWCTVCACMQTQHKQVGPGNLSGGSILAHGDNLPDVAQQNTATQTAPFV